MSIMLGALPSSASDDDPRGTEVEFRQYTYEDAARHHRVHKQTVMLWVRSGRIPSPTYHGYTARWSPEEWVRIMQGPRRPGTFAVGDSPRRANRTAAIQRLIDQAVADARAKWAVEHLAEAAASSPAKKKAAAKKAAASSPAKKKRGAE